MRARRSKGPGHWQRRLGHLRTVERRLVHAKARRRKGRMGPWKGRRLSGKLAQRPLASRHHLAGRRELIARERSEDVPIPLHNRLSQCPLGVEMRIIRAGRNLPRVVALPAHGSILAGATKHANWKRRLSRDHCRFDTDQCIRLGIAGRHRLIPRPADQGFEPPVELFLGCH
jgi:hypothetical protein